MTDSGSVRSNAVGRLPRVACVVALCIALADTPARSATWGDLIGGILNQAIISAATQKWGQIDSATQNCLVNRYGISPAQLAQNGIGPNDSRVVPYIASCRQLLARQREMEEQAERDRMAAEQARQLAIEQAQAAQQQAVEDARKQQEEADARARAESEERHRSLVARFGASDAGAIEAGVIRKGMSMEAVRLARGEPARKEVIPPNAELWTYGAQRISFVSGRVTYVGQ